MPPGRTARSDTPEGERIRKGLCHKPYCDNPISPVSEKRCDFCQDIDSGPTQESAPSGRTMAAINDYPPVGSGEGRARSRMAMLEYNLRQTGFRLARMLREAADAPPPNETCPLMAVVNACRVYKDQWERPPHIRPRPFDYSVLKSFRKARNAWMAEWNEMNGA